MSSCLIQINTWKQVRIFSYFWPKMFKLQKYRIFSLQAWLTNICCASATAPRLELSVLFFTLEKLKTLLLATHHIVITLWVWLMNDYFLAFTRTRTHTQNADKTSASATQINIPPVSVADGVRSCPPLLAAVVSPSSLRSIELSKSSFLGCTM